MRPTGPARLGLLTFPQRWEAGILTLRFLCMPKGDPREEDFAQGEPAFAAANLVFEAHAVPGLEHLPDPADALSLGVLALEEPPLQKALLFAELAERFHIVPRAQPLADTEPRFRKSVVDSYLALTGRRQLSEHMVDADGFRCALNDAQQSQPSAPVALDDSITWGRLLAFALRQPKLAMALGLVGQASIELPDSELFAAGGWLFVGLHPSSDYAAAPPALVARYAARVPPLGPDRPLYAAVLFPVDDGGVADDIIRDAELYDYGFARMVHGAQSTEGGDAIQLAWDDEQTLDWLARQVDPVVDAPMGTAGYRVDVREPGGDWRSLVRIESAGDLTLGPHTLGPYAGEAVVEVVPAQIAPAHSGRFWLPPYFATWRGGSLALTDPELARLQEGTAPLGPELEAYRLNREQTFLPVDADRVPLRYGRSYEFRVRLADLTRGGPEEGDEIPALPNGTTTIQFQRHTPPGRLDVLHSPTRARPRITLARPRLGFPEAIFTGAASFDDLVADRDGARAGEREVAVPDPDVVGVEILVEVRALDGDIEQYLPLYRTTRDFRRRGSWISNRLRLQLDLQDHATLDTLAEAQPAEGALAIPTARHVRLTLVAMGREDAGYFASEVARRGIPICIELYAEARSEAPLFAPVENPLRSFFFQPPPEDGSVAAPAERLAGELGLDHAALTLAGHPGRRTVIACSAGLSHTLSPERAALTLASGAEVVQRWVNVLHLRLARDWSWEGLAEAGMTVRRRITRRVRRGEQWDEEEGATEEIGAIRLPHALAPSATAGVPADPRLPARQASEILFLDALDPKPVPGEHPTEITVDYLVEPAFRGDAPASESVTRSVLLPVTTPPAQLPRLVSAGIALSPYEAADDYSSTEPRRRMLWLEFESPPADPDDAYFVRVLASAPDPLLLHPEDDPIPEVQEPPLAIDPEWMRLVVPGQPRDEHGLRAMQRLEGQADDGRHYLVPLPEGMTATALELFGMFTYEIRLGHTQSRWTTAKGRFGPPLRVAGVQHPAPPLACETARSVHEIRVRAPFATPVHESRNLRPAFPRTALEALLYARVRQSDAAAWRNLLLTRTGLHPPRPRNDHDLANVDARVLHGEGTFAVAEVEEMLRRLGLPCDSPLTALVVEHFTEPWVANPFGHDLGHARMLRVSPLVTVPETC